MTLFFPRIVALLLLLSSLLVPVSGYANDGDGEGDGGAQEVIQNSRFAGGDTATSLFRKLDTLRYKLRGVGIVILLIMGGLAGVMASFGKTSMAMSVLVGAVIFFALSWAISLIQLSMSGGI